MCSGEGEREAGHLAKRRRKNKGLEVGFDPEAHREFVGGFRKRKLKRRQDAQAALKKREREEKNKERSEKRAKLREQLRSRGFDEYGEREGAWGKAGAVEARQAEMKVFKSADVRSVVTIEPLQMGDSDSEHD